MIANTDARRACAHQRKWDTLLWVCAAHMCGMCACLSVCFWIYMIAHSHAMCANLHTNLRRAFEDPPVPVLRPSVQRIRSNENNASCRRPSAQFATRCVYTIKTDTHTHTHRHDHITKAMLYTTHILLHMWGFRSVVHKVRHVRFGTRMRCFALCWLLVFLKWFYDPRSAYVHF